MREQRMSWWKRLLRQRRQKDSVKVALLSAAAAIGFVATAVSRGVALYQQVNAPVEYVLSGSQKQLSELENIAGFVAASPQQEHTLTVQYQGQEYRMSYYTLSKEYLEAVYGIQGKGATATYYMNQAALRQLGTAEKELLVLCLPEEPEGDGVDSPALQQASVSVKLRLAEGIFDQKAAAAFALRENHGAETEEGQVRACFGQRDLDGSQRKQLEQLGYSIVNQESFLTDEYQKEELLLRMKYEALIGLLLGVGAAGALQYRKNNS